MRTGTNTIFFLHPSAIPKRKKVTYCRIVSSIRPLKIEVHQVKVTVGGDRLEYSESITAIPAQLSTVKIHINCTISTRNARYIMTDIKDFFCGTPMKETDYEYAQIPLHLISRQAIFKVDLCNLC